MPGSVTYRICCHLVAPSMRAASFSAGSSAVIAAM